MKRFLVAAITGAAVAVGGCGGTRDASTAEKQAQGTGDSNPQTQQVTLTGCVTAGSGSATYVLHNIRVGGPGQDPQSSTTDTHTLGITEGSVVRLTANGPTDLSKYVGQRVTLTGSVVDSGASTIGTGGSSGNPTPSGDRSQAATSEHHSEKQRKEAGPIARNTLSNGMAAEVRVQTVQGTGERCSAQQRTDR